VGVGVFIFQTAPPAQEGRKIDVPTFGWDKSKKHPLSGCPKPGLSYLVTVPSSIILPTELLKQVEAANGRAEAGLLE